MLVDDPRADQDVSEVGSRGGDLMPWPVQSGLLWRGCVAAILFVTEGRRVHSSWMRVDPALPAVRPPARSSSARRPLRAVVLSTAMTASLRERDVRTTRADGSAAGTGASPGAVGRDEATSEVVLNRQVSMVNSRVDRLHPRTCACPACRRESTVADAPTVQHRQMRSLSKVAGPGSAEQRTHNGHAT